MNIAIRDALQEDINFIYATWLRSYRSGSSIGRQARNTVYYREYNKVIDHLLNSSTIKVACLDDDPLIILGYAVFDRDNIHYIFVKEAFRRLGIARRLVESSLILPETCTHTTFIADKIIDKFKIEFNPFKLFTRGL